MNKRNKYVVAALVLIVIAGLGIWYMSAKNTTFKEVVLDKLTLQEISSIEIVRSGDSVNQDEITVTDSKGIERVMNAFSQTKLRESNFSNINYTESYWITLEVNGKRRFGITLYDKNYIAIYEYDAASQKNTATSYKITNEFDPRVIRDLFR